MAANFAAKLSKLTYLTLIHLAHWHSETDWSIGIPIYEDEMSIIQLHFYKFGELQSVSNSWKYDVRNGNLEIIFTSTAILTMRQ